MRRITLITICLLAIPLLGAIDQATELKVRLRIAEWMLEKTRAELEATTAENALLQGEVASATDLATELQAQVDAMAPVVEDIENLHSLTAQVTRLRQSRGDLSNEVSRLTSQRNALASGLQTLREAFGAHGDRTGIGNLACSPSMLPLLWCDDMVAGLTYPEEVGIGDIIFFTWPDRSCKFKSPRETRSFIDHRVTAVIDGEYQTKGDNLTYTDKCLVPHSAVWMKVTHIAHGINYERGTP